jgi:peptidoglycan-associated lipoprotein
MTPAFSRSVRLAAIALAAAWISACSHPRPLGPAATNVPPPPPAPPPSQTMPAPGPGPVESETGAPIPGSARDFVINVGDRVYFDFDQYAVRPDGRPVLEAQVAWLRRYPEVRVRIEGNCDERGTREYNFALGARRANSVREYLVAHGVSGDRIATVSYGKEHPLDPGSGEEAWAHNRNAHTDITSGAR